MAKKSNSLRPGTTLRRAAARAIADALRPKVSPAVLAAHQVYLMALRRTATKPEPQQKAAVDAAGKFLTEHGASAEDCAAGLASAREVLERKKRKSADNPEVSDAERAGTLAKSPKRELTKEEIAGGVARAKRADTQAI